MDCPDCGRPMSILDQNITGDDTFYVIETEWYCIHCELENETGDRETWEDGRNG